MTPATARLRTQDRQTALALLGIAILLRLLLPVWTGWAEYAGLWADPTGEFLAYREALREHPFAYLWYNHVTPSLYIVRNALLNLFISADWVRFADFVLVSAAGTVTTVLTFLTLRRLSVGRLLASLAAIIVSVRLVLWEVWNWGASWDAFNPALIAFTGWCLVRLADRPDNRSGWLLGIAGAALVGGFSFGPVTVAGAIAGIAVLMLSGHGNFHSALRAVSLPVLMIALLVAKNGAEHGLWSTSSGAGQNVIQNLNLALIDPDGRGARNLAAANGYPGWWTWCYDEAERRGVHATRNVAGFYGMCILDRDGAFDYDGLRRWLAGNDFPAVAAVVKKDGEILAERPYLWAGPVHIRATGFSILYGKVSQRVFWDVLKKHPRNFAGRAYDNLVTHFIWHGGLFLVGSNRASISEPYVWRAFNLIGVGLFFLAFAVAVVVLAVTGVQLAGRWVIRPRRFTPSRHGAAIAGLAAMIIATALVSAAMACCENYRHAFCFFPVAIVLAIVALDRTGRMAGRITGRIFGRNADSDTVRS